MDETLALTPHMASVIPCTPLAYQHSTSSVCVCLFLNLPFVGVWIARVNIFRSLHSTLHIQSHNLWPAKAIYVHSVYLNKIYWINKNDYLLWTFFYYFTWYVSTNIMFLDIIHRPVFYLKHITFGRLDSASVFRWNPLSWARSLELVPISEPNFV
jgi:hypothetical protein